MSLAADTWPTFVHAPSGTTPDTGRGVAVVWRGEVTKLAGQLRVRVAAALCLVGPLVVVVAFRVQSSTPSDTPFGQWIPSSGWAIPMVMLTWVGQWLLPALTAIVAGDIFSSEDHLGTWKTVLTRSRSRGQLFAGKLLAALTYAVVVLALLIASCMLAGVLGGSHPVVGLSGQTVPAGHAAALTALSWTTQLLPMVAFTALAVLLSVVARNSVIGIGGPVLLGLVLQLLSVINLPLVVRHWLINTPFSSWLGLWTQPSYSGPVGQAALTSAVWAVVCAVAAWVVFRRRDIAAA